MRVIDANSVVAAQEMEPPVLETVPGEGDDDSSGSAEDTMSGNEPSHPEEDEEECRVCRGPAEEG